MGDLQGDDSQHACDNPRVVTPSALHNTEQLQIPTIHMLTGLELSDQKRKSRGLVGACCCSVLSDV